MVTKEKFDTHVQQVKVAHEELQDNMETWMEAMREDISKVGKASPHIFWET